MGVGLGLEAAGAAGTGNIWLEAQVAVCLHQLGHSGWRASVAGLGPPLPQALDKRHQLDNGDPHEVDDDLGKFNEAQYGAPHPEAELAAQIGQQPDDLGEGRQRTEGLGGGLNILLNSAQP